EEKARRVFEYQFEENPVYRRYCTALRGEEVFSQIQEDISNIPLLPIQAFKEADLSTQPGKEPDLIFKSSGTSDMQRSIHKVPDAELYEQSLLQGFRHFYDLDSAVIWGYTPGY